jgi:1-acyl-sn-glycerol-3-phosphate acyltransferase
MTFGFAVGRAIRAVAWVIVQVVLPYRVIGKEYKPKKGQKQRMIMCCNHISFIDPAFLLCSQPVHVRFMAKNELFKNKFLGFCISHLFGAFPVDRGKGDVGAIDIGEGLIKDGDIVGIFPEGTRSKTGELGRFKTGASLIIARTGATMLPVALVTKDQKIRPFRRTTVVYGKPMTPEELHLTGDKPDLRYATRTLSAVIAGLIEEGRR